MRKRQGVTAVYFCAYFAILLLIAFFVHDEFIYLDSWIPANKVISILSPVVSDPVTFIQAATDIYLHGALIPADKWILHLWPPGFIFLEAAILKLTGLAGPLVALLQVLVCGLFAGLFLLQRTVLRPLVGGVLASLSPLLIMLFPVARIFLLSSAGVTFGEAFSIATFFASAPLIILAIDADRLGLAIASGASAAIAAYFRSQYESIIMVETIFAGPLIVWFTVIAKKARTTLSDRRKAVVIVRSLALSLFTAHLLMLPWRLHNLAESGSLGWVQTLNIIIENSLMSEEPLLAKGGRFVIEGGGNLACRLEPTYCGKNNKSLFWRALVRHPIAWIEVKSSLIGRYWFSSSKNVTVVWQPPNRVDDVCNSVFLICVLAVPLLLLFLRREQIWLILLWLNASFYCAFFVILLLAQFEVRYFYLVKLHAFSMCILLLGLVWRRISHRRTASVGIFDSA